MKYLVLVAVLFLTGCVTYSYEHSEYYPDGQLKETIKLSGSKAMVKDYKKTLDVNLPDGALLGVDTVETESDPNYVLALARAVEQTIMAYNGTNAIKFISE